MTQAKMSDAQKARVSQRLEAGEITWDAMAHELGITYDALRGQIRRYRKKLARSTPERTSAPVTASIATPATNTPIDSIQALFQQFLTQHGIITQPEPVQPVLYDAYPADLDDTEQWQNWKQNRLSTTVMLWYDLHIPDHDNQAIALATKLVSVVKPDVIIFGGDIFDFDALGTYQTHPRRRGGDAFQEIQSAWDGIIDGIMQVVPNVKMVALRGNHEDRLDRWQSTTGTQLYNTTEKTFVQLVRSSERVWWLGELQETNVGNLIVQHGKRYGENAAKNSLKDKGWATPLVQGHNHRPTSYIHKVIEAGGGYRIVTSLTSGCLCNVPPHYQTDTRYSAWLQGVAVAHVDEVVDLQPIVFHKHNDKLVAWYGGQKIE